MLGAVILAAGKATRYGQDKLIVPLADGRPLGSAIAHTLLPFVDQLVVVLGPDQHARRAMFDGLAVRTRVSPATELGMGHSLATGVAALDDCESYLIALADMPWIRESTVRILTQEWHAHPGAGIMRPRWRDVPGHPVLFDRRWRAELLALRGDRGARDILERYSALVRYCDVDDEGVVRDVDRPADLIADS